MTQEEIARLAYYKWEEAGRPDGLSEYFWRLAEKEPGGRTKLWIRENTKIVSKPGAALQVKTFPMPPWIQEKINNTLKNRRSKTNWSWNWSSLWNWFN